MNTALNQALRLSNFHMLLHVSEKRWWAIAFVDTPQFTETGEGATPEDAARDLLRKLGVPLATGEEPSAELVYGFVVVGETAAAAMFDVDLVRRAGCRLVRQGPEGYWLLVAEKPAWSVRLRDPSPNDVSPNEMMADAVVGARQCLDRACGALRLSRPKYQWHLITTA